MNATHPVSVTVVREFDAPAERLFDAWLDERMIGQWMFGAALRDEEILRIAVDARVGGKFSFLVRREGTEIDHVGTWLEIDRPRRLAFTWGITGESVDESRVTIDFVQAGTRTQLTLTHELAPKWAEYASRTEAGWTYMLETLGKLLLRS
ncbi:MAG TPA: SRPBCC family protein [Steroidobacteraceae bacterium]